MKIKKKVLREFFQKILNGEKKFEVRLAEWQCKVGDILVLQEIDEQQNYTGRVIEKEVTYVLKTNDLNFFTQEEIKKHGFQCLSLADTVEISEKTFDREIGLCRKMHKKKKGCAWGKCENCGVLPLLQKLRTGKLIEDEAELKSYKEKILK